MKGRFTEEYSIGFLRYAEAGMLVKELCLQHGFSKASCYLLKCKSGSMNLPAAGSMKEQDTESARLKELLAEPMLKTRLSGTP